MALTAAKSQAIFSTVSAWDNRTYNWRSSGNYRFTRGKNLCWKTLEMRNRVRRERSATAQGARTLRKSAFRSAQARHPPVALASEDELESIHQTSLASLSTARHRAYLHEDGARS